MLRFSMFAVSLLFCFSCGSCKDKNCPDFLQYEVPYTAAPIQDTFHLGDTIWIEMNFADTLTDLNGGITNIFSNFNFKLELQCDRFDIDPPQGKAVSFMDPLAFVGEVTAQVLPISDVSYFEVQPLYANHIYHFKSAFVLKEEGGFLCTLIPNTDNRTNPFKITGNCDQIPLYIQSKVNSGSPAENNYQLLKSSPVSVYRDMTLERFGAGAFCFVVKP
ncbi:MAG: hypothetical protein IPJ82_12525 [Lewinellaceae bacterium]|nr:hypothetical protein [Lewinellaceae bacterium]